MSGRTEGGATRAGAPENRPHFIGSLKAQQTKISASVASTPRQNAAMARFLL
jgi:hypothetical protein